MKKKIRYWIFPVVLLLLFQPGCRKQAPEQNGKTSTHGEEATVIAEYDGGAITLGELEAELKKKYNVSMTDAGKRLERIVLEDMIRNRLLDEEAGKSGIGKRPDIEEQVEAYRKDLIRQTYLKEKLESSGRVSVEEANRYYNEHLDEYEEVRLRDILIRVNPGDSTDTLKRSRERAEEILKRAMSGEDFAELAGQYSEDLRTKNRGGDMGFIPLKSLPGAVPIIKAAAALKNPGDLSDVVADATGFHILCLVERRTVPFERVQENIQSILGQQKKEKAMADFMESLLKAHKVVIHENAIHAPGVKIPETGHP